MAVAGFWVYILRCSDSSLYTGCAKDVAKRLVEHNSGRGAKYTRSRLPVTLVFKEKAGNRGRALRRENEIKKMSRGSKLLLISSQGRSQEAELRFHAPS